MKRIVLGISIGLLLVLSLVDSGAAQQKFEFKLGFKTIADQIPDIVGVPLENEWFNPKDGNSLQRTVSSRSRDQWGSPNAFGMMVWRKVDNWTAFTDGGSTWINGPNGLQKRANNERFSWEKDPLPAGGSADSSVAQTPPSSVTQTTSGATTLQDAVSLMKAYLAGVKTDQGFGSAVSLGQNRFLTAAHVITGANQITLWLVNGRSAAAQLTGIDLQRDLALLWAPGLSAPAAPFGDSSALQTGDTILVLGYPRPDAIGLEDPTLTRGVLSSRRTRQGMQVIQTDAAINPGNSGGPVADGSGG